jgi:hypothetical protein
MAPISASKSMPHFSTGVLAWLKQAMVGITPWLNAANIRLFPFIFFSRLNFRLKGLFEEHAAPMSGFQAKGLFFRLDSCRRNCDDG